MQIYAGSSNPELARSIVELGGYEMGEVEIGKFANGETRVWVRSKVESRVVVVQSLSTPTNEHLVEFCLICDALHRGGAREITAVIPWMGYSKQDKIFRPGEPLSAKVVAQILQTARLERMITIDLHNRATLGFFDIPVMELSARELFLRYFRQRIESKEVKEKSGKWVVVAPDAGAVKASTAFAEELGLKVVYIDKKRDLVTGKVRIGGMSRPVGGKEVIIIDDNIFTGSTIIEIAKLLKKNGAKSIYVGVTHHLNVEGVQDKLEQSGIEEIVVTDTIAPMYTKKKMANVHQLKRLSVAQMIVDEVGEI